MTRTARDPVLFGGGQLAFATLEEVMAGKRSQVRFAVGSPSGPRASVWRLWTQRSDVYMAVRSIGGIQKVSLHEDGNCFLAFTREHVAQGSPFLSPGESGVS